MSTTHHLLHGDTTELLRTLDSRSVDMVFADPPYNLQLKHELRRPDDSAVDGVTEQWDQFQTFRAYDDFTMAWLTEAHRVMRDEASIWVMGSYHNIFRVGRIMQDLGFWILNDVIWVKNNPMPNFRGTRLTNAHETLIWAAKSERAKYTFNYHSLKVMHDDLQARSDWYFPICSGGERARRDDGTKVHPTQKPLALVRQALLASSMPGDVILDPFMGSGTTAVAAKQLGRNSVGIERDPDYIFHARQRVTAAEEADNTIVVPMRSPRAAQRIPFGTVVSAGLVEAGEKLTSICAGQHAATVHADASISVGEKRGSIHKVAAELLGRDSCNGWTYWKLPNGQLLDWARQRLQAPSGAAPAGATSTRTRRTKVAKVTTHAPRATKPARKRSAPF